VSRARGLVLILTGLAAAAYVPLNADKNGADADFLQYSEIPDFYSGTAIASATEPAEPLPDLPVPVVVTVARRRVEPPVMAEPRACFPRDREAIGRQLQKELKRVGCYEGQLHGVWTTSTRQAMQTFIDRVNARLPTREPDGILLTLVQGYHDKVCGQPCPTGQAPSDTGRCLPSAMLAWTSGAKDAPIAAAILARRPTAAIKGWTTTAAGATLAQPTETAPTGDGMALAGPTPPPAGAAPTRKTAHPVAAERRRPVYAEREGSWARSVFRQQERLGTN
jgi:Putative peptidoglycan binding domain